VHRDHVRRTHGHSEQRGKIATATLNVTGGGDATAYTFAGFFQPIDMSTTSTTVWNTLKAGQAVARRTGPRPSASGD
jgi:hypothetical protein